MQVSASWLGGKGRLYGAEQGTLHLRQQLLGYRRFSEIQPRLRREVDHVAFEDGANLQPPFLAAGQLEGLDGLRSI